MIPFRDIKADMREACIAVSRPGIQPAQQVARITRARDARDESDEADQSVAPWMEEAFEALMTACITREPFMLLPCTVNGEPTAAIVHVADMDNRRHRAHVTPLFVAMTPGMVLIDQKGRRAGSVRDDDGDGDEGGGRDDTTADAPAPS
jgi:hypothetical protein